MANICSSVQIGKILYDLTGPWAGYYKNLDTNMETLKRQTELLNGRNNDINEEVDYAEQRSRKRRRGEVKIWQENVRKITDDVQTLERQEREVRGLKNALNRAKLGKCVVDMIEEVAKLYKNAEFSNGLLIDDPTCGHAIPTAQSLAETTSARNKEKIWNFLMDDAVRKIGVHGMGGIGKTTVMKHINNQLLVETCTFNDVIWVTVSKAFKIKNLQRQIAKKLNLCLSDYEDKLRTASEIHNMLSQKKSYVLILDDLWKAFPLEEVGIPEPTRDNGCKLVLTTRLLEVCTKMKCRTVEMELLAEDEALNLFMNDVKEHQTVLTTEVEEIAKEVAKKCACLPLAIAVMAGCMRGVNDIREWRNARNEQWHLDKEERLFGPLKFSYSRLKDEQERHCFLYCALYPEDDDIDRKELIEHWIAEDLIRETDNRKAMFNKGHTMLNKLIKASLLIASIDIISGKECVKMHDVIRDMALKITSTSPRFMVRAGEGLKRVPHKDWSEDLERVSLMWNDIQELPSEPICPRLTTFLLQNNESEVLQIPDSFFKHMPRLKVLDLSCTAIESLPNSISMLENLHQLLLDYCENLKYVPSLEKLKALKHFKLTQSQIEVPQGIEELVNLRKLILSQNHNVKYVPSLEKLKALEHFELSFSKIEEVPQGIEELVNLRKLILSMNRKLKYAPSLEKLKALEHFELSWSQIEEVPQGIEELVNLRKLQLWRNRNVKYVPSLEKLKELEYFALTGSQIEEVPQGIEELVNLRELELSENRNVKYVPSLEKLKALEHFRLRNCQIEEIPEGVEELVNLRTLDLSGSHNLGMSPCRNLCKLTQLHHLSIQRTKIEVSAEELLCLKQLKVLKAEFHNVQELTKYVESGQCERLEGYKLVVGIVDNNRVVWKQRFSKYFSSTGVDAIVLPSNLEELCIRRWDNHISLSDIQSLRAATSLIKFSIYECSKLESIFSSASPSPSSSSSSSSSSSCFSEDYHIPLTTIKKLSFTDLPNFRVLFDRVVPPHNISFNLKILEFCDCPKIENIFSALWLHNFPNLEKLKVEYCENVEEIIVEVETSDRGGHREDDGNTVTLPNLKKLHLENLPSLESIYKGIMVCESLGMIEIVQCPMLRRLPISLHMNKDGEQASAPLIWGEEKWWKSLEWDNPLTKTTLQRKFLDLDADEDDFEEEDEDEDEDDFEDEYYFY